MLGMILPQALNLCSGLKGSARLVWVADGDTIKVMYNGKEEFIRLLRIDTPEQEEKGYEEATYALEDLVEGVPLDLEFEAEQPERDRHGRLLAYVIADGVNVNVEMVRLGWTKSEGGIPGLESYEKGERSATVMISEEGGVTSVTIAIGE